LVQSVLRFYKPKKQEVTGSWCKLLTEEFHNVCSSPTVIEDEVGWACNTQNIKIAFNILVGKP
jgi:hypothetical protein